MVGKIRFERDLLDPVKCADHIPVSNFGSGADMMLIHQVIPYLDTKETLTQLAIFHLFCQDNYKCRLTVLLTL